MCTRVMCSLCARGLPQKVGGTTTGVDEGEQVPHKDVCLSYAQNHGKMTCNKLAPNSESYWSADRGSARSEDPRSARVGHVIKRSLLTNLSNLAGKE